MKSEYMIVTLLCVWWCGAGDDSEPKFKLNIGAGGAYVFSQEYINQFGTNTSLAAYSGGSIIPSLAVGCAINPRFSLFLHYSHFLVYRDRPSDKFQQLSYIASECIVEPSEKFRTIYLSYSFGYLQFWQPTNYYEQTLPCHGWATTVSCGYRVNNRFRIQIDMDYLTYGQYATIHTTTIDQQDSTNTIRDLGEVSFSNVWFNVVLGLSAYWDIF